MFFSTVVPENQITFQCGEDGGPPHLATTDLDKHTFAHIPARTHMHAHTNTHKNTPGVGEKINSQKL